MGNTQSTNTNVVQDFAAASLELRHGKWFSLWGQGPEGRWWRDPSVGTRPDRQRQLRTFASDLDRTDTGGRINQLELLIQESTFFCFWKIYRIIIGPCIQDDARTGPEQVIVLVSCLLNFQTAINLLICLARVEFYVQDDQSLQRYFSQPNINARCEIVRPVGEWPPRTDRITEGIQKGTQIYSNTKFRRLSTAHIPESDLEADIVLCHGLGGDLMRTWTCPGDTARFLGVDKPWPANQLLDGPHSIYQSGLSLPPRHHIRVLTVGHGLSLRPTNDGIITDSIEATRERIWANMRDSGVGKRPMVWLGHSLGCLLLKEVLLFDAKQPNGSRLKLEENLKGIIFYGGPHNGSVFAGALTDFGVKVSIFSDALRFHFQMGSPATAYLSTVSSLARNRHAELNKFFFDDLSVPFINFRESKAVQLTTSMTSSTAIQIVKNEESDVNDGGIRTVESGFVPTDVSVEGFSKIRIQLLVEHDHLDICAPQWLGEELPDIYKVSRDAIAAWLCKQTEHSHDEPTVTVHHDNHMLFAQLFAEVLALLHAVVSLGMPGQITPNEALVFRCAWSDPPVFLDGGIDDLKSSIPADTKQETESVPTDLEAELQRISSSLSSHRQGWADLSEMTVVAAAAATAAAAGTGSTPAQAAFLTVASCEAAATTLVLQSLLRPFTSISVVAALSAALAVLLRQVMARAEVNTSLNATNLLTTAEREFAIKRPDVIQLVDAIRPQLMSVFDELQTDGLELRPEIKYAILRRCRDIIFAQLCAEHVPANNEDMLGQAIARLDGGDGQMKRIIAGCQMYRAKARRKAGLPV